MLNHKRWGVEVDKILHLAVLEVAEIARQIIVYGIDDDNFHIQFKQEVEPIRHRPAGRCIASSHSPELGEGGRLVFYFMCWSKWHGEVCVPERNKQVGVVSQTEAADCFLSRQ